MRNDDAIAKMRTELEKAIKAVGREAKTEAYSWDDYSAARNNIKSTAMAALKGVKVQLEHDRLNLVIHTTTGPIIAKGVDYTYAKLDAYLTRAAQSPFSAIAEPYPGQDTKKVMQKAGVRKGDSQPSTAEDLVAAHPGLSKEAAEYIISQTEHHEAPSTPNDGITRITITPDAVRVNAMDVLEEYYGRGNVPADQEHRVQYKGEVVRIENGKLLWESRDHAGKHHRTMLKAAHESEKIIRITKDLQDRYGTTAQVAILAVSSAIGGVTKAGVALVKGMTGDAILEPIKEKAIDGLAGKIQKMDPFLAKHGAKSLATVVIETAALGVGASIDTKKTYHPTHVGQYKDPLTGIQKLDKIEYEIKAGKYVHEETHVTPPHYPEIGDLGNPRVLGPAKLLPKEVPAGRVDYSQKFLDDLRNFEPNTASLHHGPLKEDLWLINYHDSRQVLHQPGPDGRTLAWATHIKIDENIKTVEDLHRHLGLKYEWGKRDQMSFVKIPKGTDVTFITGKAEKQFSDKIGLDLEGGGFQVRFRDFDENWVVAIKPLTKPLN